MEEYISENRIHVKGLATLIPLLYKLILLCQTTAYSLFEFRDLLPIQDVYRLYCKVGEPHTARDFLKATCTTTVSSEPICYLKRSLTQTAKYSSKRGFNAVPVALSIMFLPEGNVYVLRMEERVLKKILQKRTNINHMKP